MSPTSPKVGECRLVLITGSDEIDGRIGINALAMPVIITHIEDILNHDRAKRSYPALLRSGFITR